jgi:hypothetical protein
MKIPANRIQVLKNQLVARIKPGLNLNTELADLLNLSQESVYRRFRNEVSFSFDEIVKIDAVYNLDLHALFGKFDQIKTDFTPFYSRQFSLDGYLKDLKNLLQFLIKDSPFNLYSLCSDVPMFRIFGYPMLAKFKLYYWNNLIHPANGNNEAFQPGEIPLSEDIREMHRMYKSLKVKEFWCRESIRGTLDQIEYFATYNMIPDQNILFEIYSDLYSMVEQLIASENESPNELFLYELSFNNNSFFVEGKERKILAFGVNSINSIKTDDKLMIKEYQNWLEVVKSRSFQVSRQSYRLKKLFKDDVLSKIDASAKKILSSEHFQRLSALS